MAYYVTNIDHPHTAGLTTHAQLVLDQHDLYADWTIYLAGVGLVVQLLNQFLLNGRRWSVLVVALVLTGAAYCVAMAGHYGAQLVHIEGVGPQGKYLDTGHHQKMQRRSPIQKRPLLSTECYTNAMPLTKAIKDE